MGLWKRQIVVSDDMLTRASHLTLRQSMVPNMLGLVSPQAQHTTTHVANTQHHQ